MNKRYIKELTAFAALALFVPWANAQTPADDITTQGDTNDGIVTITEPVEIDGNDGGVPEILLSPGGNGDIIVQGNDATTDFSVEGTTGNVFSRGDLEVNGTGLFNDTLTVQPELTTTITPTVTTPGAGEQTELGGVVAGSGGPVKVIQTLIDSNDSSQTEATGGGFTAETNGDTTLSAATSETTSVSYGRAVTQEVAQPGNGNPVGLGIPGTEQYYVVNLDNDAQIAGPFATEAALDAFLGAQTPASLLALDPTIGDVVNNPSTGGNLQVGGDANVDGTLSLGDTGSGAVADAAAAINSNTAGVTSNQADIVSNDTNIVSNDTNIVSNQADIVSNDTNIVSNQADIVSNDTNIVSNQADIVSNDTNIVSNQADIVSNDTNIVSNQADIVSNDTNIVSNQADIVSNDTNIVSNDTNIVSNQADIVSNDTNIVSNDTNIVSNQADIVSNDTNIVSNQADIVSNDTNIVSNQADIVSNDTNIVSNDTNIVSNQADIVSNDTNIVSNQADIVSNDTNIGLNTTAIASNNTNIVANDGDIASNNTNIVSNQTDIAQEVADRSALISDEGPNADGNQVVHIGDNSLITEELGGTQRLRAEDGAGDEIPIRFDGSQGVYVDNYINVTAPDAGAQFAVDNSSAGQVNPETDTSGPTTTPVVTVLGTVTGTEVDGASGGVLIESNGDVTLSQGGGTESTVELVKVTQFEAYNADQPNAGQPVPGTQEYAVGYLNGNGDFVELQGGFASDAAAQAFIESTPLDDPLYSGIVQTTNLGGTGGNLTVGGNAYISGLQSSYNPNGDVVTEFGAVNSAIAGNSAAIANNSNRIDRNKRDIEENRRGIAMVAALQHTTVLPGMTNALDVGAAYFEGETGMSLNYARRINENWQINFGAASTTDFEESVIKAGVGVQW